jgi:hypothetical protein
VATTAIADDRSEPHCREHQLVPCPHTCPREIMRVAYSEAGLPFRPVTGAVALTPRGWFARWWSAHTERRHQPYGYLGVNEQPRDAGEALGHRLTWN